jgi:hypothetical protein
MTNDGPGFLPLLQETAPVAQNFNWASLTAIMHAPTDMPLCEALFATHWISMLASSSNPEAEQIAIPTYCARALANRSLMAKVHSGYEKAAGRRGYIAGDLVFMMWIISRDNPAEASLNRAIHLAVQKTKAAKRWGDGEKIAQTSRQIRSYWDEFKTVVHLWAAKRILDVIYPNRQSYSYEIDFVELLEWSEAVRRWLEGFTPFRAQAPVAKAGDLMQPPEWFNVERRELPSHTTQLASEIREQLNSYRAPTSKFWSE